MIVVADVRVQLEEGEVVVQSRVVEVRVDGYLSDVENCATMDVAVRAHTYSQVLRHGPGKTSQTYCYTMGKFYK